MDIRPYAQDDREHCLGVFDSNAEQSFAQDERGSFNQFLEDTDCPYFVMEHAGAIVGCGGYRVLAEQHAARLVWGMVRADLHKQGLGRFLLLFRLREIGRLNGIEVVELETSTISATFFTKQGFQVVNVIRDGFGPGLDRVKMVKRLAVCS